MNMRKHLQVALSVILCYFVTLQNSFEYSKNSAELGEDEYPDHFLTLDRLNLCCNQAILLSEGSCSAIKGSSQSYKYTCCTIRKIYKFEMKINIYSKYLYNICYSLTCDKVENIQVSTDLSLHSCMKYFYSLTLIKDANFMHGGVFKLFTM